MPFAAGVDSGVNHPGVIAGLHSRRLDWGGGGAGGAHLNQFALDDATGQLRTWLHASHAAAELALGHLIQHAGVSAQRGAWRGSGFEAATAGWSSVRAGQRLLLSTTARAGTYGKAEATQMDASEATAQLKAARDLGQRLGQAASSVNAQRLSSHDDGQALAKMLKAIDPREDGKHPATVKGQAALQPGADGRNAGGDPVQAFAQTVVLLDTPSALLAASSASIAAFAGQALSVVAQGDLQQSAAHTMTQASGAMTSVYAHQGGIAVMAANGTVSLRAHTDALSVLADQSVTIISVNGEITIGANQEIQLVAGQSAITLKGGDIEFRTPGAFTVHAATHAFKSANRGNASLPDLPNVSLQPPATALLDVYDEQFRLVGLDGDTPLVHQPYKITSDDGQIWLGITDSDGLTMRAVTKGEQSLSIEILPSASSRVIT